MAVPAYKRKDNRMTIINKVQDMMKEVIRLSKNEKILPKKTEKILKQTFLDDAMKIYKIANVINELNLNDEDERKIRRHLQIQLKIKISEFYSQIKLNIAYLDTAYSKYENLILILDSIRQLHRAWMKSDIKI